MDRQLVIANVKHLRTQREWTQDALAERVGVTPGYIGLIERGERYAKLEVWSAIADALGVDLETLTKVDLTHSDQVAA